MAEEITITNYRRSRKFGWGWTCAPTGEDAYSIEVPKAPDYTGTLNQVAEAKANDRAFNNLGGAFYNIAYFYDGKRITHTQLGDHWLPGWEEPYAEADVTIRVENGG